MSLKIIFHIYSNLYLNYREASEGSESDEGSNEEETKDEEEKKESPKQNEETEFQRRQKELIQK